MTSCMSQSVQRRATELHIVDVLVSFLCLNLSSICLVLSYLLGTSVPNLGALLGMLMVVGLEPGLDDGDESILPLD